jgi:hypothetical protein
MTQTQDRLQQFRRLRESIRGCKTTLVVGIDIAKDDALAKSINQLSS